MNVALQLVVVNLVLKEVFARLFEFEVGQPLVEKLFNHEVLRVRLRLLLKLLVCVCSLFLLFKLLAF